MVATICIAMKLRGCELATLCIAMKPHAWLRHSAWMRHSAVLWNYVVVTLCIALKLRGCGTLHCCETMALCFAVKLRGCDILHCQGTWIAVDCDTQNYYETTWLRHPVLQRHNTVAAPCIAMKQHWCNILCCKKSAWLSCNTLHCYVPMRLDECNTLHQNETTP